jgi:glutamate carboxypeptidase
MQISSRISLCAAVFATPVASVLLSPAHAEISAAEQAMVDYIDSSYDDALELLIELVDTNSGTMNFEGVRAVGRRLEPEFESLGFDVRWEDGSAFGRAGHLVAELRGTGNGPKLLLIGHLDTVFEPDSPFQRFEMTGDGHATGPGIADMKGGNVIILQALRALESIGALADLDVTVVMTGDEELSGRPLTLSKNALIDAAVHADVALGFENGDGNPETANVSRRGSIGWTLTVAGRPAHSSQVFSDRVGAGAIYEAARILTAFYDELRSEELLTFNPGRIFGGTTVTHETERNAGTAFGKNNVVAESAIVTGDIRAVSEEQLERARAKMLEIAADNLPMTHAEIVFGDGYPPMAPTSGNERLLMLYSEVSEDLGLGSVVAVNPRNAGAADISFAAGHVDMALDALGMSGTAGHTVDETGVLAALSSQASRAAVLIYRLTASADQASRFDVRSRTGRMRVSPAR